MVAVFSKLICHSASILLISTRTLSAAPTSNEEESCEGLKETDKQLDKNTVAWPNAYSHPITYRLVDNEYLPEVEAFNSKRAAFKEFRRVVVESFQFWQKETSIRF